MPIRLAAAESGAGPPLAILHGLFGSGRNWAGIAQLLAARYRVVALDLRNHGASPWAAAMGYAELAGDVRETLFALGHRRFALIGHSMGGKVAMMLALEHGRAVERLVVVDIAPVGYPPGQLSYARAMRALDLGGVTRRSEADRRLAPVIADAAERAFLLQNLVFEEGVARWRLNLAAIEREMPHLAGFPALSAGAVYAGPALFLSGGRSDYLRSDYQPEIRRLFPNAGMARIQNAGHWPHAEQPKAFVEIVGRFLAG